jgi:hypothetical protein
LIFGPSVLLFDTAFDKSGTTGFFMDIKPAAIRWPIKKWLSLEFCPLGFAFVLPVMHEPIIRRLEYRTTIGFEVSL